MKTLCSSAVLAATVISCALLCVSSQSALAQQRPPAVADGTPEIDQAIADKQLITALSALDKRIASNPTDVQAKFKRATVLAQLKRDDDAIAAFTALTQQYPEVPEPYNNLAALYAKRGDLSQARATLETAVAANPAFALGYQNLGTLYLQMSSRAYQRAAALDHGDTLALQRTKAIEQVLKPSQAIAAPAVTASAAVASSQPGVTLPGGPQTGNPQSGLLSPSSLNHRY